MACEYIDKINTLLPQCNDISLLDLVCKLLERTVDPDA